MNTTTVIIHAETPRVIVGEYRCPAWHPEFRREGVARVWPSIALPRVPVEFTTSCGKVVGDLNTAVFFSMDRPYKRRQLSDRGSHTDWIEVHPDTLSAVLSEFDGDHGSLDEGQFRVASGDIPTRAFACRRMGGPWQKFAEREGVMAVEERAITVVRDLLRSAYRVRRVGVGTPSGDPGTARLHREAADHVRTLLSQNLRQSIDLASLGRAVGLSGPYLCRVFSQQTGETMRRYRQRLRLRAALEHLSDPRTRVLEAALSVGYSSETHLSDAFIDEFGLRPGGWRRGIASPGVRGGRPTL